jgi:hypothetical protein
MTIETILYGKRAIVRNEEELKLFKRKEGLVAAARTLRAHNQPDSYVMRSVMGKIIRLNRKIESKGLFVQYLE